jgi:hypothetical protein
MQPSFACGVLLHEIAFGTHPIPGYPSGAGGKAMVRVATKFLRSLKKGGADGSASAFASATAAAAAAAAGSSGETPQGGGDGGGDGGGGGGARGGGVQIIKPRRPEPVKRVPPPARPKPLSLRGVFHAGLAMLNAVTSRTGSRWKSASGGAASSGGQGMRGSRGSCRWGGVATSSVCAAV